MRLGQDGRTPDRHRSAIVLGHHVPEVELAASHLHRGQKMPVRQRGIAFHRAADAYILLGKVIKRSKILVGNGPIPPVAVEARRFQIKITQPIALPAPA